MTASTAVVLFLLPGKVIKPCGDFSLQSYSMLYMISFFFLSAFIFANRTLSQPESFQFSPSKVPVKKTNKKLVFWKVKLSFNAFFALNCFEILLEALRITHNMIPQPVEVWCHYCTET